MQDILLPFRRICFAPIIDNLIEHGGARPRLGVSIASIEAYEEFAEITLDVEKGAVITRVEDGGAAQYAGIIPNDVVISVDGQTVNDPETLIELLNTKSIGDTVLLTVYRDGLKEDIAVRLKAE